MPKYSYQCDECGSRYEIWHGMTEEHNECNVCGAHSVVRIPAILGEVFIATTDKVGTIVNENIDKAREEVERMKSDASKELDI